MGDRWDMAAWITANVLTAWSTNGRTVQPDEINPLKVEQNRVSRRRIDRTIGSGKLPATLTEAEIADRWERFCNG